jgi:hypothetical protein
MPDTLKLEAANAGHFFYEAARNCSVKGLSLLEKEKPFLLPLHVEFLRRDRRKERRVRQPGA